MKIICMGSFNRDMVYAVEHIAAPGETIAADSVAVHWGGKGLNQALALSRAYNAVSMAGFVHKNDADVLALLQENKIDAACVQFSDTPTGHAIISVDAHGQNSILLFHGANYSFTPEGVKAALSRFSAGDILLLQNEINCMDEILRTAKALGLRVALNPSPFEKSLLSLPLDAVHWFLINEIEGEQLTGCTEPAAIAQQLHTRFPDAEIVLTLGGEGVYYRAGDTILTHAAYKVPVVDTTAAGDTFTGFFLGSMARGESAETALEIASKASAIAVSRKGATTSIPSLDEVNAYKES